MARAQGGDSVVLFAGGWVCVFIFIDAARRRELRGRRRSIESCFVLARVVGSTFCCVLAGFLLFSSFFFSLFFLFFFYVQCVRYGGLHFITYFYEAKPFFFNSFGTERDDELSVAFPVTIPVVRGGVIFRRNT